AGQSRIEPNRRVLRLMHHTGRGNLPGPTGVVWPHPPHHMGVQRSRHWDGRASMRSEPSPGAHRIDLQALLAAIKSSPIVLRLTARVLPAREWARVRKSPDVDAYVLAWIASHVRHRPRRPHHFM